MAKALVVVVGDFNPLLFPELLSPAVPDSAGHDPADPDSGLITKTVYLLGIVGAVFHFSNGLNTFCMTWGIALTPKSQIRVRIVSIFIFFILTASSIYALSAIW